MDCPHCKSEVVMSDYDERYNKIRLNEQKELRDKGTEFKFKLIYSCPKCGNIFIEKTLRRK
jgi:ribosomal protein S27AE